MPGLGDGGPDGSLTKMKPLTAAEKNAKKAQRKREKEARRKSRR
jgi:signal recognition particle subunit SRP54